MPNFSDISLIFALGNPGEEYAQTYHNAGFLVLDQIISDLGQSSFSKNSSGNFEYTRIEGYVFVKSRLFMNQSGDAVREALSYFSVQPRNLLLMHDEADIPLGDISLEFGRGAAGHHGVESTIEKLGTADFWRARIGINRGRGEKAGDYVLRPIHPEEFKVLYSVASVLGQRIKEKEDPSGPVRISVNGKSTLEN